MKAKFLGVSAVEISQNSKIGLTSATYVSQRSCPRDCPFFGSGCYAENGNTGFQTARLNREVTGTTLTALQLAISEAAAIRTLTGRFPLRLHVVGDCKTPAAARIVSSAAEEHSAKFSQPVWTYTHAWRSVARVSWGSVSVLASCETVKAAKLAMAKGYAAAIVVKEHASDKAYQQDGIRIIPCPQQTGRAANCESCKLCFKDSHLRATKSVIAFHTHGNTTRANNALVQIGALA